MTWFSCVARFSSSIFANPSARHDPISSVLHAIHNRPIACFRRTGRVSIVVAIAIRRKSTATQP